jgi:hypothetical protein
LGSNPFTYSRASHGYGARFHVTDDEMKESLDKGFREVMDEESEDGVYEVLHKF